MKQPGRAEILACWGDGSQLSKGWQPDPAPVREGKGLAPQHSRLWGEEHTLESQGPWVLTKGRIIVKTSSACSWVVNSAVFLLQVFIKNVGGVSSK